MSHRFFFLLPYIPSSQAIHIVAGSWKESWDTDEWWGCEREYRPSHICFTTTTTVTATTTTTAKTRFSIHQSFTFDVISSPHVSSSPPTPKGEKGGILHINIERVGGRRPNCNNNSPPPPPLKGGSGGRIKSSTEERAEESRRQQQQQKQFFLNPWCLIAITDLNMWGGGAEKGQIMLISTASSFGYWGNCYT